MSSHKTLSEMVLQDIEKLKKDIGQTRLKNKNYKTNIYEKLKNISFEVRRKLEDKNYIINLGDDENNRVAHNIYVNTLHILGPKHISKNTSSLKNNSKFKLDNSDIEDINSTSENYDFESEFADTNSTSENYPPVLKEYWPVFIELGEIPTSKTIPASKKYSIYSKERVSLSPGQKTEIIEYNRKTFAAKLWRGFTFPTHGDILNVIYSLKNHIQRDTSEEDRGRIVCDSFINIVNQIKLLTRSKDILPGQYIGYESDLESVFIILYRLFIHLNLIHDNGDIWYFKYPTRTIPFVEAFNFLLGKNVHVNLFNDENIAEFLKKYSYLKVPVLNQGSIRENSSKTYENIRNQPYEVKVNDICFPNYYSRDKNGNDNSKSFKIFCDNIESIIVRRIKDAYNVNKRVNIEFDEVVERKSRNLSIFQVFKFFTEEYDLYLKQRPGVDVYTTIRFQENCSTKLPETKECKITHDNLPFLEKGVKQLENYPLIVENTGIKPSRLFRTRIEGTRWRLNKNMFRRVVLRSKYGGTRKKPRRARRTKRV